jgi:hypothetical protein
MKLRLAVWGIFLALCVTPAFADSLHFTNKGLISASGSDSGIDVVSWAAGHSPAARLTLT